MLAHEHMTDFSKNLSNTSSLISVKLQINLSRLWVGNFVYCGGVFQMVALNTFFGYDRKL